MPQRRHRIDLPHRLIKLVATFYYTSEKFAITTIATARGEGLAEEGTVLQILSAKLINTAWHHRWIVTGVWSMRAAKIQGEIYQTKMQEIYPLIHGDFDDE